MSSEEHKLLEPRNHTRKMMEIPRMIPGKDEGREEVEEKEQESWKRYAYHKIF